MLLFALVVGVLRIDASVEPARGGSVQFSDRNGLPLGVVLAAGARRRTAVRLADMSPAFLEAIVCVEDARFYRHPGIDPLALARASAQLLAGDAVHSGASTITMQLARLRENLPSTPRAKLREMWMALRIEAGTPKNKILEAYANALPMGGNIYGIEAAAQTYFGEPAADLDLAQSALLAALPNDPVNLNPRTHWRALRARQRFVLARMQRCGAIDAAAVKSATNERLHLFKPVRGVLAGAHFLFGLAPLVSAGTASVQTTLDRPLQTFVETQLRALLATLASRNVHQGAALVLDNRSGDVLAYAGSADYFDDENRGRNDGVAALRQPGSALKPFLYELALERGAIESNTVLADVPVTYAIPGGRLYQPADYSNAYAGPVRVRAALANSLNVPAVRVLAQTGTAAFLDRLHDLGFTHLNRPASYYGLGLTLGGGEVTLRELTTAYLTMARRGVQIPVRVFAGAAQPQGEQIGNPALWALITDMLADDRARSRSFGAHSILELPFAAAVKTGTSSDFRDTWTVGFSQHYTVGVWVGNFDGKPMRRVSGVTGAAPLWNRIMLRLHEREEPPPFEPPPGMVRKPICATTGRRPLPGCAAIVSEYLFAGQLKRYASPAAPSMPRSYDEWLAMQGAASGVTVPARIVFPHDGDDFVINPQGAVTAPEQAIVFALFAPRGTRVRWELNGRELSQHDVRVAWALRRGTWHLRARAGTRTDEISFRVSSARERARRGFSY